MPLKRLMIFIILFLVGGLVAPCSVFSKDKKENPLKDLKLQKNNEDENDLRALKTEALIANTEEKAIEHTQKLISKYKGTPLEPDLLLRLGELYMRRAKTDRFLELQKNSDNMIALAPKLIKNAQSKAHVQKAISIYDEIERRYSQFERLDQVLFNNAFACQQLAQDKKAEGLFIKLIQKFSDSPLIPDSHLALGEMKFQRRDFDGALVHFQAIKNYPDSMVYGYGLYKAAWAYYNLRDTTSALKELEAVVKYGRFVAEQGVDARLDLRKEALTDMALFYEEVMPAKNAISYFDKQAGRLDSTPYLIKLADLYKRHGRLDDNRILLSDFIKKKAQSDYLPKAYLELADTSDKLKNPKDTIELLANLQKTCQPKAPWSQRTLDAESPVYDLASLSDEVLQTTANTSSLKSKATSVLPKAHEICLHAFRKSSLSYAQRWLKTWHNTKATLTPEKAQQSREFKDWGDNVESAFRLYLSEDDKKDESNRARYVYADLLFQRQKFRDASQNYAQTADQTADAQLKHDARYYSIVALEKATQDKWNDKDEKQFRFLAGQYLTENAKGPYRLDLEFKMALIAYEKSRYDEAATQMKALGEAHAETEKGLKAQDIYLDILNIKKDYASLRDYSDRLRKLAQSEERKAKLNKIFEESYFLIVQDLENKNQLAEAILRYETFAEQNPTSALAQKASWNAMQLLFKVDRPMDGANSALKFYEKYPLASESREALIRAAGTFEALGHIEKAASTILTLSQIDKGDAVKWTLMAADYYFLLGDYKKSADLYSDLKKLSGETQKRAFEQLELIANLQNDSAMKEKVLKEAQALQLEPQSSQLLFSHIEKAFQGQDDKLAFELAKKFLSQPPKARPTSLLAQARWIQAQILDKEFRAQNLKSSIERVHIVLQLKTEKLSQVQSAYQSAANYGFAPVAVRSLEALAASYDYYVKALRTMPMPKGVPEEEEPLFRAEIQKLAMPMEDKAIETKNLALQKAIQAKMRDGTVVRLKNEIDRMNQVQRLDSLDDFSQPEPLIVQETMMEYGFYPTRVDGLACPTSDRSWKKEGLTSLVRTMNNCMGLKKYDRVAIMGQHIATEYPKSEWGPYYLSLSSYEQKAPARALWYIDLALKRAPKNPILFYHKALLFWSMNEHALAVQFWNQSISQPSIYGSTFAPSQETLGRIYYRDGDYRAAAQHFEALLRLQPQNAVALVGVAEFKRRSQQRKEAISYLERAIQSSPRVLDYRLRLADLYESEKRFEDALVAYRRAQALYDESLSTARRNRNPAAKNNDNSSLPVDLTEKIKILDDLVTQIKQNRRVQKEKK